MFVNFDLYVEFLSKKKLTPTQFAICWMIHFKDLKNIKKYNKEVGPFTNKDVSYLLEQGYLLSVRGKDTKNLHLGELTSTPLFSEEIIIDNEFTAFQQLVDVYIPYFMIHGKKQVTTPTDKDATARIYHRKIKGDKIKHKIILAKTKIVADMMRNGELNPMKLDKYVTGEVWMAADLKGESGDLRRDL